MKLRLLISALLLAAPLHAQEAGSTGAQVLQFLPGSRAAALSGAYTAVSADADALFYNPAGVGNLSRAATLAYESYVSDVAYGSLGVATRLAALTIGASVAFLNAGDIREVVPDPEFGGNTGVETGQTVSASESALRIVAGLPLLDGRLRAGAALGFVATALAEQRQHAPIADLGAQYDLGRFTVGVLLRNLGTRLSGDAEDELPTEARLGAYTQLAASRGRVANLSAELIHRTGEASTSFAAGAEAGLLASDARPFSLLARIGIDAEPERLSNLRAGASLGFRQVTLDYTFQQLDFFGAVHRFGVRFNRLR